MIANRNQRIYCDTCGHSFDSVEELEEHRRNAALERPLRCLACGATFNAPEELRDHLEADHVLRGGQADQAER